VVESRAGLFLIVICVQMRCRFRAYTASRGGIVLLIMLVSHNFGRSGTAAGFCLFRRRFKAAVPGRKTRWVIKVRTGIAPATAKDWLRALGRTGKIWIHLVFWIEAGLWGNQILHDPSGSIREHVGGGLVAGILIAELGMILIHVYLDAIRHHVLASAGSTR
jgi:hypothetical protein